MSTPLLTTPLSNPGKKRRSSAPQQPSAASGDPLSATAATAEVYRRKGGEYLTVAEAGWAAELGLG